MKNVNTLSKAIIMSLTDNYLQTICGCDGYFNYDEMKLDELGNKYLDTINKPLKRNYSFSKIDETMSSFKPNAIELANRNLSKEDLPNSKNVARLLYHLKHKLELDLNNLDFTHGTVKVLPVTGGQLCILNKCAQKSGMSNKFINEFIIKNYLPWLILKVDSNKNVQLLECYSTHDDEIELNVLKRYEDVLKIQNSEIER